MNLLGESTTNQKRGGTVTTRTKKQSAEQIAFRNRRNAQLEIVRQAITDGRAFLDTAWGCRQVTAYNDATGWAVTRTMGMDLGDRRSFMVTLESVRVEPKS
jgi:ABC-type phosphonate transport system ATPase subunit